ncbi:MAG: glucose 1-dehydrogenase [Spirochaetes bacterium]|jgi:NAD(P)-dependent dehydrogenase (short-subunit alcohol dehydrogenase family)|nr:glucose 1-dehydrogenase [Spirochaetota bacterium]
MRVQDRVAIVTGAARGIGRACALQLAEEGAKVVVSDIDDDAGAGVVAEIADAGGDALFVHANVTHQQDVEQLVAATTGKLGTVHILVNNAGTDVKGSIDELPQETWDFLMELNLRGTFLCTQAVMPEMRKNTYGRIVCMSSMAGKSGEPFTSPYCATKFGVIGFIQSVALEVGPDQITINAVCPGAVETDLNKKSVAQSAKASGRSYEDELYEKFIKLTPLGRMATPKDVAQAVAFLASDEASFITGSSLNVSGGREMH